MDEKELKLRKAPIVEAVLDIDCDMPPALEIGALEEKARDLFRESYPHFKTQIFQEHELGLRNDDAPPLMAIRRGIQALQFLHEDEKQLVQIRRQGFSFNRLDPYSNLDDYVAEIERVWYLFLRLASPLQTRVIRLHYINRFHLPIINKQVDLDAYLKMAPRLPDKDKLSLVGFLNQHTAMDRETGNEVTTIVTSQLLESGGLPIILDITVAKAEVLEPGEWSPILSRIQSLRKLKNRIFRDTLTEKCLDLFQ